MLELLQTVRYGYYILLLIPLLHHLFLGVNNYMRKPSKKSCKQVYLNFKVIKNIHLRAKKCLRIKFLRTLVSHIVCKSPK